MNGELPCPRHTVLQALIAYHLHEQTGRSTVWANGTQNSGLVNFVPESCLPFAVSFSEKRPRRREDGSVKNDFEKMEHEFPFGTLGLPFPMFRCSREICHRNDPTQKVVFHLTNLIFRKLFVNGKQLLFQNVILNLVSFVIAERNKGSRQI